MLDAALNAQLVGILIASIRVAMVLAFAPPFTYLGAPVSFRVFLALGIGACFASFQSGGLIPAGGALLRAIGIELFVGLVFVVVFQIAFSALETAGRVLDVQAGQGFAGIVDPATKAPAALSGAMYTRAAAFIFFAVGGHLHLMRLLAASFDAAPTQWSASTAAIARLGAFATTMLGLGLTIAGAALVALFLTDTAIALLARTAPQINALILGIQVKSLVLFLTLPITFGVLGALFPRMNEYSFSAILLLLGR
jgi:flagellar biosynthetic protein FliR